MLLSSAHKSWLRRLAVWWLTNKCPKSLSYSTTGMWSAANSHMTWMSEFLMILFWLSSLLFIIIAVLLTFPSTHLSTHVSLFIYTHHHYFTISQYRALDTLNQLQIDSHQHVKEITSANLLRDNCNESFLRVSTAHNDSISNDTQSLIEQSKRVKSEEQENTEFYSSLSGEDGKVSIFLVIIMAVTALIIILIPLPALPLSFIH